MNAYRWNLTSQLLRRFGATTTPYKHGEHIVWLRDEPQSETLRLVYGEVVGGFYDLPTNLEPGSVVVDIGAHVGGVSIPWALANPQIQFHAFEPTPTNKHNLAINKVRNSVSNLHIHYAGLGASGSHLRSTYPLNNTGSAITEDDSTSHVPAYSLQQIRGIVGGHIHVLKLDCEGAEHSAIQRPSDLAGIDFIIAEIHETPTVRNTYPLRELLMTKPHRITTHTLEIENGEPWTSRGQS